MSDEAESNMASASASASASAREQEEVIVRRRTKTHKSHGFFEPVEEKFSQHIRFADPLVNMMPTQTAERFMPAIWLTLRIIAGTLATVAILGPVIILSNTAIRGIQLACHSGILPRSTAICNSAWTEPLQPSLHGIAAGRTPLTTILGELGTLNEMSASLEFLGLPLYTIVTNLTNMRSEPESSLDAEHLSQWDKLGNVAGNAQALVESFSAKDNVFRQQISIWERHAIADVSEDIAALRAATNTSSNRITALREGAYHSIPFLSKRSLSYRLVLLYHNLVSANYSSDVEGLVLESTETKLALQDLLGRTGMLETQIRAVAPTQADALSMMRLATAWALGVVQFAEHHYKSMYTSLRAL